MRTAHTVAAVRAGEHALMARVPDGELMQRAAAGLAATCARLLDHVYGARVVVLAGSGDNGGDALYAGARLAARGAHVTAIAVGSRLHAAAAAELRRRGGSVVAATADVDDVADPGTSQDARARTAPGDVRVETANPGSRSGAAPGDVRVDGRARSAIAVAEVVIDGLTGIGGQGGLREPAATLARLTETARCDGALVVAVDLPSGIDADTGAVTGAAVRADVTVTFGTLKPGLLIDPGAERAGPTELIDIGLSAYLPEPVVISLQAEDVAAMLPHPSAESDKYRRGVLGLVAGSEQYTGAAVLSAGGAIKGGAGMVRLVSAAAAVGVVRQHWPEAVLTTYDPDRPGQAIEAAGRVQAWAIGPGIGTDETAHELLATVLASDVPVLIDADGLTVLAAHRELLPRRGPTLITPHAGELARLLKADRADIEAQRLHYATAAAAELGITVLLKGSTTVIAQPGEGLPVWVNSTGSSFLATAGSGDVLSGLAGSLLAQGLAPPEAAAVAAYLHGLAGRLAARDAPIGASDLFTGISAAIRASTGVGPASAATDAGV
jgi:ADP-dependent NAD(P)H-hydrate dehydratase / NAD(P)H-hydrate epimerase